jgi:hypothetical protein
MFHDFKKTAFFILVGLKMLNFHTQKQKRCGNSPHFVGLANPQPADCLTPEAAMTQLMPWHAPSGQMQEFPAKDGCQII